MKLKHIAAAALALAPLSSFAAGGSAPTTASATLTASAVIIPACTVAVGKHVNFGDYAPAQSQDGKAEGEITVLCSDSIPYTVTLSNGQNATGSQRKMASAAPQSPLLAYGLYSDSKMLTPWGPTQAEGLARTGTGAEEKLPVYGKLGLGQTSRPGYYVDTVNVIVTFDGPILP